MRLGLGARPGELDIVERDPRGWLHAQISPGGADQPSGDLPGSASRLHDLAAAEFTAPAAKDARAREFAEAEAHGRVSLAVDTPAGFRERWALFWINHFAVHVDSPELIASIGPYEREAIRPHVFGRFEDLARAALKHPALLFYYQQAASAGPQSPASGGLNENLAREFLELLTVGREAGYSQADVTETALALTGMSVGSPAEPDRHRFVFREDRHQPGPRRILGRSFPAGGEGQIDGLIADIAARPDTARMLARKVARHFVSDDPPASLVHRLALAYGRSGGSLAHMAHALIDAPETWDFAAAKFKTPYEFYVSIRRALGRAPETRREQGDVLFVLDQALYQPSSPRGWPDTAAAWATSAGLAKRVAWVRTSEIAKGPATEELAATALGPRARPETLQAARRVRAASGEAAANALLFLSPEFQWR